MNQPPRTFVSVLQVYGVSAQQIDQAWQDLNGMVIADFLEWLVETMELDDGQLTQLEEMMRGVHDGLISPRNHILELLKPMLKPAQHSQAVSRYGQLVVDTLETFYAELREKMTDEQRVVADRKLGVLYD